MTEIEARVSLVTDNMAGQLLSGKGEIAEDEFMCPRRLFWAIAEYVMDCHMIVECYRKYGIITP